MRNTKKRLAVLGALALVAAALPMTMASPAYAAGTNCQYYPGPTPAAEADINGDGQVDVRVPSFTNISVCAQTDAFLEGQQLRWEMCDWFSPFCWALYVHPQAGVTVDTGLEVCRTADLGTPTCTVVDQTAWTIWTPDAPVMCIGFDIGGGSPCTQGSLLGFVN